MNKPNFTQEQIDFICSQIGNWYCDWKHRILCDDGKMHRLGYAREELKSMICDTSIEHYKNHRIEIVRLHPNFKIRVFIGSGGTYLDSFGELLVSYEEALNKAMQLIDAMTTGASNDF